MRAPLSRVWRALADAEEFGRWFGFEVDGTFAPGAKVRGKFNETLDEAALVAHQKSVGVEPSKIRPRRPSAVFCTVERTDPERYFSFRWIPMASTPRPTPKTSRRPSSNSR